MWRAILFFLLIPGMVLATNAGIVQGLWYDRETIFVNSPTRIYVAVRNNTGADLSGTVEFFINDERIARNSVAALDGRIVESWADWTPTYGTSTVVAQLSRTELSSAQAGATAIEPIATIAEDTVFVDYDTDGDGIGNEIDTDDDGDGKSDADELKNNTDPLDPNDPKSEPDENDQTAAGTTELGDDTSGSATSANTSVNRSIRAPSQSGLEQFLEPSRADTLLSSVTEVVATTKEKIDTYRSKRAEQKAIDSGEVTVNRDGFGEIKRSSAQGRELPERPEVGGIQGVFYDFVEVLRLVFSGIYTLLLFIASALLGYPALMQLLLLLLILYLVYSLAKRFGRRSQ